MAKHLTENDIQAIISIIDGWQDGKLTWDNICNKVSDLVGKKPTRQSLNAHELIKNAYLSKKGVMKNSGNSKRLSANQQIASDRINNLESKVARLEMEVRKKDEKYVIWQYNAYKHGMTEEELNQPLPPIDRERTDDEEK